MNFKQVICKRKSIQILYYSNLKCQDLNQTTHFHYIISWKTQVLITLDEPFIGVHLSFFGTIYQSSIQYFSRKWNKFSSYVFLFFLWGYIKYNITILPLIYVKYFLIFYILLTQLSWFSLDKESMVTGWWNITFT